MGPQNYALNVVRPIERLYQAIDRADAKKQIELDRQRQREQDARQITEDNRRQSNTDRTFGRRVEEGDRAYNRGITESDRAYEFGERKFEYGQQRDAVLDQHRAEQGGRADQNIALQERSIGLREDAFEAEQRQQREQQARQTKAREDMAAFANKPDKSAEDYAQMIGQYPEMAKELRQGYDLLDDIGKRDAKRDAVQVYGALTGNSPEAAIDILNRKKAEAAAAGKTREVASADAMIKMIELDPEAAKTSAGLFLASATEGTDLAYTLNALGNIQPGNTAGDVRKLGDYGRAAGLSQSKINRALASSRGSDYATRKAAIDALIESDDGADFPGADQFPADDPADKPKAAAPKPADKPKYKEGQRARNPQTGETMVFRNGNWTKE